MGNNVSDKLSIIEILEEAIKKEHASCEFYNNAASSALKPSSKKMFHKLAEMEMGHANELKRHLLDVEAQLLIDKALTSNF
ncbi:MAG: hypothetical protein HZA08_01335 [Nitrospirae bacterium]|nr:hypothetical protein [Nitrospirota bacterium]